MKVRHPLLWLALLVGGFLLGHGWYVAKAQQDVVANAWEIYPSAFGQQSFYVVKHNRLTGETWVLSGEKGAQDNSWLLLPEVDKRSEEQK